MSLLLLLTSGAAPSGVTGTVATTNANDTATASGSVAWPAITGTAATTNATDTASASGSLSWPAITGTIATTNANDSAAATGDSGAPPVTVAGGAARPRMRYERRPVPTIEDELEEIAMALLLLL